MATLSAAYVAVIRTIPGYCGKIKSFQAQITVPATDTVAYGDGTNTILAAALGFQELISVSNIVDADNHVIPAVVSADGSKLITPDADSATEENHMDPAGKIARVDGSTAGVYTFLVTGIV